MSITTSTHGANLSRARRGMAAGLLVLALVALAALAVGCGGAAQVGDAGTVPAVTTTGAASTPSTGTGGSGAGTSSSTQAPSSAPTTTSTTPSDELTQVTVYFVSGGGKVAAVHRQVPRTVGVATAAVRQLLLGPTPEEQRLDDSLTTAIPTGTRLLGISVKDGVALVDLSKEYASGGGTLSMSLRLAQMVYTLTQFPTIDGVNFALDGKPISVFGGEGLILDHPVSRSDYEELTPAIMVENPALGDDVSSPLRVTGTANVFEAVFFIDVVDADGTVLTTSRVQASSGTGTRGTFDVTVRFTTGSGNGALVAYSLSPKDGSRINEVKVPLSFAQ